ncbi:matrix-remodeling-associated protein 7 isoform X2 [Zootermopsis nevadensis]|uniref:matrix-remodeling-associated protein 7 isoform X2 n=1 Tax=Zootermopsis nevadensis TaxID=136037 RepID=UPI000B8E577D|nr:matrix-remodeling-associated protein 7 isoform X2 [Zootermopsis nevadensis]
MSNEQANDLLEMSNNESILSQIKMSRQKAIVEQLSAGLTEEQLQQEKETERKQLEAIFQLLKEQEDKFHVNSMEELEDQLRLYRR